MSDVNRINISVKDSQKLKIIDKAAKKQGMSRSEFMIEAGVELARKEKPKHTCEVCGEDAGEKFKKWKHAKKHDIGNIICSGCIGTINALPESAAKAAIRAKNK